MGRGRDRLVDAAIAGGVAAVVTLVASAHQDGVSSPAVYPWAAGLGALMFGRRRFPVPVLGLTVFGVFAYYAAGLPAIGVAVPVAAALYSAAEAGWRRVAIGTAVVTLAVSITFRLMEGQDFDYVVRYDGIGHVALMGAAIALGELVRARRRIVALSRRQAELEAERRVHEHRQALSRELHDSIGHALTVAAIHTNVARQEVRHRPEAAVTALDHVAGAVSDALTELRGTVRGLRSGPAPSLDDRGGTASEPAASLDDGYGTAPGPMASLHDGSGTAPEPMATLHDGSGTAPGPVPRETV